jgi:hypothetical protein
MRRYCFDDANRSKSLTLSKKKKTFALLSEMQTAEIEASTEFLSIAYTTAQAYKIIGLSC